VDETVAALRSEGLEVSGCACHVGSAEQRQQLVERAVKVGGKEGDSLARAIDRQLQAQRSLAD
jgi:diaminopimelate decarboxylase